MKFENLETQTLNNSEGFISDAIIKTYNDDRFWTILLDQSSAQSGPFDGGCLICAKAMMLAFGGGNLGRITSPDGKTQHYGVELNGAIYDFDGRAKTSQEWIDRFMENESISEENWRYSYGIDSTSIIPDDPKSSKLIADLLTNHYQNS